MVSLGILDGQRPTAGTRRRGSRYRLFAVVLGVSLAVFAGSYVSHSTHDQQLSNLQKRSRLDEPLGLNDSYVSLSQELVSRAVTPEAWEKSVRTGKTLWCMMNSENVQPGTVTKDELEKTGWEEDDEISDEEAHEWRKSLETADGKMNVDNEFPRAWYHSNPWKDDQGRTRRATTGSMGNIVNAKDGYIIAGVNFAPWDVKPKDMEAWELPSTKWTDIVAVQWSMYASGSSLQRIYRSSIVFERTKDLIEGALNKVGKGPLDKLPKWPGVDYTPKGNLNKTPYQAETEGFFGLLGSPHGAGAAYLLIQYRAIFGKKRITKIKVWSGPLAPNMILYVEDV